MPLNSLPTPLVSILVPVFNRALIVHETVESIRNQSYQHWECVLVDDGSTDDSVEILRRIAETDSRFKVFQRPVDRIKGAASCRNFAFEMSRGELVQYFDSDDVMLSNMLEEKVARLYEESDADFLVSKMGEFDEKGPREFIDYPLSSASLIPDFLRYKVSFLTPGPIFRRAFLERFSVKFDENLQRRQEREFYTRIILSRPRFVVCDRVHCMRRIHSQSIKTNFDAMSPVKQVWAKFNFYQRLTINSAGEHSVLIEEYFGSEITRMIFFFLKEGEVRKSLKALNLRVSLWKISKRNHPEYSVA